jgi:hypothetical protein
VLVFIAVLSACEAGTSAPFARSSLHSFQRFGLATTAIADTNPVSELHTCGPLAVSGRRRLHHRQRHRLEAGVGPVFPALAHDVGRPIIGKQRVSGFQCRGAGRGHRFVRQPNGSVRTALPTGIISAFMPLKPSFSV